jgi:hypothetical protein
MAQLYENPRWVFRLVSVVLFRGIHPCVDIVS